MASLPEGLLQLYYKLRPARTAAETTAWQQRKQKRSAKRALSATLSSQRPPAAMTEARLKALWLEADRDKDGSLSQQEAAAFLTRSGLARPVLARIWNLSRAAQGTPGTLTYAEFAAAMRLIGIAQQSEALLGSAVTVSRALSGSLSLTPRIAPSATATERAPTVQPSWAIPLTPSPSAAADLPARSPIDDPVSTSSYGETAQMTPLQAVLARADHKQRASDDSSSERRTFDVRISDAPTTRLPVPSLSPPPSSTPRGGFAAALQAHGYTSPPASQKEPERAAADQGEASQAADGPAPSSAVAWVHEEHRAQWVDGRLTNAGLRGLVFALPGEQISEATWQIQGALVGVAAIDVRGGATVTLVPANGSVLQPLQDSSVLWRRTKATLADPQKASALIKATNPAALLLHVPAGQRGQPAAVCRYILGSQFAPPLLAVRLRQRAVVVPFRRALDLAVVLRCVHKQQAVHNVRVVLHPGDSLGEGELAVIKASRAGGQWDSAGEVFAWTLHAVQPGETVVLRVQLSADPRAVVREGRPPAHVAVTAALPPHVLASELEVAMPPGTCTRTSTHAYCRAYMSTADEARHSRSLEEARQFANELVEGAPSAFDEMTLPGAHAPHSVGRAASWGAEALSSDDEGSSDGATHINAAAPTAAAPMRATVLFPFTGESEYELTVSAGDELEVVDMGTHGGWYQARLLRDGRLGLVPASYLALQP
jgi:hypothetical protein